MLYQVERGELRIDLPEHVHVPSPGYDGHGSHGGHQVLLRAGDLALLFPHGYAHTATPCPPPSGAPASGADGSAGPGPGLGGSEGTDTDTGPDVDGRPEVRWIAGTLTFDAASAGHLLAALPPAVVLPAADHRGDVWREVSVRLLTEEISAPRPGGSVMVSRILDLLFIQILRAWAARTRDRSGWLIAAMDPALGRVLTAVHRDPARPWTVTDLAGVANLSRSVFADRFTTSIGQPPGAYLTARRLDLAADLLRRGGLTVAGVAGAVGYTSESAFSRAFRRHFGASPLRWRRSAGAR